MHEAESRRVPGSVFLTVTLGPVLQTERNGQHGVIFKELCSK